MNSIEKYMTENKLDWTNLHERTGLFTYMIKQILNGKDGATINEIKMVAVVIGVDWYELIIEFYL